jgi:hypothetical protein
MPIMICLMLATGAVSTAVAAAAGRRRARRAFARDPRTDTADKQRHADDEQPVRSS